MSGFLYFAVGDTAAVTPEKIAAWGLGYAFDGPIQSRAQNANNVAKAPGVLFARDTPNDLCIYDASQSWRQMPEREGRPPLWIGYREKPTPESLARERMLPGLNVMLADENFWIVPTVRDYVEDSWKCELPALLDFDAKGQITTGDPLPQYRHLWDITAPLADRMLELDMGVDGAGPLSDSDIVTVAVTLLQANYRVDLPELVHLGALVSGESLALIVTAACRRRQLLEWLADELAEKKSESTASGSDTTAGNEG